MDSILIPWLDGNGNIVISNIGGDKILISSDTTNDSIERSQTLTFVTSNKAASATLEVVQKGNRVVLKDSNGLILKDSQDKILTAKK